MPHASTKNPSEIKTNPRSAIGSSVAVNQCDTAAVALANAFQALLSRAPAPLGRRDHDDALRPHILQQRLVRVARENDLDLGGSQPASYVFHLLAKDFNRDRRILQL